MAVVISKRCGGGCLCGLPQKQIEISGCILVDSGDGFAMDDAESKKAGLTAAVY